jgi:hypothetical protein
MANDRLSFVGPSCVLVWSKETSISVGISLAMLPLVFQPLMYQTPPVELPCQKKNDKEERKV